MINVGHSVSNFRKSSLWILELQFYPQCKILSCFMRLTKYWIVFFCWFDVKKNAVKRNIVCPLSTCVCNMDEVIWVDIEHYW